MIERDIVVLGAGTGGMAAYREAKKRGKSALLLDGGPLGTTCARTGCMPSKLLIAAANANASLDKFPTYGLGRPQADVDGSAVLERVRRERDRFVDHVTDAIADFPEKDFLKAHGRFVDPNLIQTDRGDKVRAESVVIATGSTPVVPDVFATVQDDVDTNETLFEWSGLPSSVAVVGAGIIGLELGQALARLGVDVLIVGRGGDVGPLSDPAVKNAAHEIFGGELDIYFDHKEMSCRRAEGGFELQIRQQGLEQKAKLSEKVLVAAGRKPDLDLLGISNAGLQTDQRGGLVFDRSSLQCGDRPVFVAGDVNGETPLLHEASYEGRVAGRNAATYPFVKKSMRPPKLSIAFTDPQMAVVGYSFDELSRCDAPFAFGEASFADQGRARAMTVNRGVLRVYGDPTSGRVLGAEMIAPAAEHLAHLLAWTIASGARVGQVLDYPFYHPTLEEGLRSALRNLSENLSLTARAPQRDIDCGPGC